MRLSSGTELDGLRVVGLLGMGTTSEVYLVEDIVNGHRRALKLLTAIGAGHKARMVREAAVVSGLRHRHVVGVLGMTDPEDGVAVLMEYVGGPTLHAWLARYRPTIDEALRVFVGLLRGVQALHDMGLIHRDLKPGNVMLEVAEDGLWARLADFGLVKDLTRVERQTMTGMAMGTPAYMAPEQLKDASRVDHRADLFSLGCILYQMLTGEPPFERNDWWVTYKAIEAGEQADLTQLPTNVPYCVGEALDAMLASSMERRPDSAAAILAKIAPAVAQMQPDAATLPTDTAGWRTAKGMADELEVQVREARTGGSHDLTGLAQSLSDGDLEALPSLTPGAEPIPVRAPTRRPRRWLVPVALGLAAVALMGIAVWRGTLTPPPLATGADSAPAAPVSAAIRGPAEDTPGETPTLGAVPASPTATPAVAPPADQPPKAAPGVGSPLVALAGESDSGGRSSGPSGSTDPLAAPTPAADPHDDGAGEGDQSGVDTDAPGLGPGSPVEQDSDGLELVEPPPASLAVVGDAAEVWLQSPSGKRFRPGMEVPPGNYEVRVRWTTADGPTSGGRIEVAAGDSLGLTCDAAFLRCR